MRGQLARGGFRNPLHLRRSIQKHLSSPEIARQARLIGRVLLESESATERQARTITEYDKAFDLLRGESWLTFMNHGFAPLEHDTTPSLPALEPKDRAWRHQAGLYLLLLECAQDLITDCRDSMVLDIGCGRGGGLDVMTRYSQGSKGVGLDLNLQHVAFAKAQFSNDSFVQGSALRLPFADAAFQIITNVESSHLYVEIEVFLEEACRVLQPGGGLLLADTRMPIFGEALLDHQLSTSKLTLKSKFDITRNVIAACAHDKCHLARGIRSSKSDLPRQIAAEKEREYASGWSSYFVYVLQKPS